MRIILQFKVLTLVLFALPLSLLRGETVDNLVAEIDAVRAAYQADRQGFVTRMLELTDPEAKAFWPLYQAYRADMDKLGDELVKVVLEYADVYPEVPDKRAAQLLKQYTSLEKKLVTTRAGYLKRAGKKLPAAKVMRWAQLENRIDLALRLQLAGQVPVVPTRQGRP